MPGRMEKLHVLVAGGGVAALEAMIALRKLAGELVEVELVSAGRGLLLPAAVGSRALRARDRRSLRSRLPRARVRRASQPRHRWSAVDADERRVRTGRNASLGYDVLLIAIGARPREALPGALTFRGAGRRQALRGPPQRPRARLVGSVAFAVPEA